MKISEFDYTLPGELIAQHPAARREDARLMVVNRRSQRVEHGLVRDLPRFVPSDDLLVLNDTRVIPARLYGRREGQKGLMEVLLVRKRGQDTWEGLVKPGRKVKRGTRLIFEAGNFEAEILDDPAGAICHLRFHYRGAFEQWLEKLGRTPLPPYIQRNPTAADGEDRERYQTVFADASGSVAAPTAGLHFTSELLDRMPHCKVTLHVGYGTFKPLREQTVEQHRMEPEYYEMGVAAAGCIRKQFAAARRIIAVGSTSTRVLESVLRKHGKIVPDRGWTDLFIYPGYTFKAVGGLLTNFHLPRSTLLLLVMAFAGKRLIEECYREAVDRHYRFYSYGDAMLIL